MTLLVTGGAGFIGSHFVVDWLAGSDEPVVTLDALTYAGHRANLAAVEGDPRHRFVHGDILDAPLVERLLAEHRPRAIVHFAAESHVDRSIHGPAAFVRTNVEGTMVLLEAARRHWQALPAAEREAFRFHQVSTDEVYGSLGPADPPFTEDTPYAPNSPYAASKAAADHLVRAWHATWGLPVTVSHSGDNYGPRHFPEKLIPLMVVRALSGEPLPVYGDGLQERNWLHVSDHVAGIRAVLARGVPGRRYNLGGEGGRSNLDVVRAICAALDALRPDPAGPYARLIAHVADRPGHDRRYAIDTTRAQRELGWAPRIPFDQGLADTVRWYLGHGDWLAGVQGGRYREWVARHYGGGA
jgi:dTDP-glucose 4,6-dehydratase